MSLIYQNRLKLFLILEKSEACVLKKVVFKKKRLKQILAKACLFFSVESKGLTIDYAQIIFDL